MIVQMMRLKDKVIVITGSSRGIGKEVAKACASQGAKVVLCSRDPAHIEEVLSEFKIQGLEAKGIKADISILEDLERLFEFAINSYGHIDVWINNAAIFDGFEALDEKSYQQISETVHINLVSVFHACKLLIPYFIKQKGILINLSGRGGEFRPAPFMSTYAATKAAVVSLTKSIAQENDKYPVSIHSVYPGMVETSMHEDIKIGEKSSFDMESFPYVQKAFGVPMHAVTETFIKIACQEPGRITGKNYSLISGFRLIKAIAMTTYFGITGKVKRS